MIIIKKSEFQKLYLLACEGWQKKFKQKFEDQLFSDVMEKVKIILVKFL